MKINGEPVELVTDFGKLEAGDVVWVLDCNRCSGRCRSMVTIRALTPSAWRVVPSCNPMAPIQILSADGVARGATFRVINPLNAQTTERKREAVRG